MILRAMCLISFSAVIRQEIMIGMMVLVTLDCSVSFSEEEIVRVKVVKTVKAIVTAYCPRKCCCGKHADGQTALGRDARKRGAAVDPKAIPYRSYLKIEGASGYVYVDDTGGAMRQSWKRGRYHVDLRFRDHKSALEWGRRENVQVTIYRRVRP